MSNQSKNQSNVRPVSSQPIWAQFAASIAARLAENGIELEEDPTTESGFPQNKGFVRLEVKADGPSKGIKAYIPLSKTRIGRVETTLELSDEEPGVLPLPEPKSGKPYTNGAIRSHLAPDVEVVAGHLIEAVKGGMRKPSKRVPRNQQDDNQNQGH